MKFRNDENNKKRMNELDSIEMMNIDMKNENNEGKMIVKELNNCNMIYSVSNRYILYVPNIKDKMRLIKPIRNSKILIVTDRNDYEKKCEFYNSISKRIYKQENLLLSDTEGVYVFDYNKMLEIERMVTFKCKVKEKKFIEIVIIDIEDFKNFYNFIMKATFLKYFKTVGIVSNPSVLLKLFNQNIFKISVLSRNTRFFYKEMFRNAEIVFHNSNNSVEFYGGDRNNLQYLRDFLYTNHNQLITIFNKLIESGVYGPNSFKEIHGQELGDDIVFIDQYQIKSTKIDILSEIVNFVNDECFILVNDKKLIPYIKCEIKNKMEVLTPIEAMQQKRSQKIINFDLIPYFNKKDSYIFLSEDEEKLFKEIMVSEEKFEGIEREVENIMDEEIIDELNDKEIKEDELNEDNKLRNREVYYVCKYKADISNTLKEKGFEVAKNLNRMFIKPSKQPKKILEFGLKLSSLINYPISARGYSRIKTPYILFTKFVTFGHVNMNNFFNQKKFFGRGFLYFAQKSLIIIFFNRDISFKIDFENLLEKYLYIDTKEEYLNIYLLLKILPKIYISRNIDNYKLDQLLNKYKQGPQIFDVLEWKRGTRKDIDFLDDRYDIRINIDLKLSYNLEIQNKDLKNGFYDVKDAIMNLLTVYSTGVYLYSISEYNCKYLGTEEILKKIEDFDNKYYFMCLASRKGRYISHRFTDEQISDILNNSNLKRFCEYLDLVVEDRNFEPEKIISEFYRRDYHLENSEIPQNVFYLRSVFITPLSIIYNYPKISPMNRVLRDFDPDKFIRISFREDNTLEKVRTQDDGVYDYFRDILNDGFFISDRKYFFLATSASQLRLHSAWFVTPYLKNDELIGPDYIRTWLGDFHDIHNIGKYTIRLGQALSATFTNIEIKDYVEIEDVISKSGYCFTDGIGKISTFLANKISESLNLEEIPSAFQIRFGGYKGVVTVDPSISEDSPSLYLRKSMKKFDSNHNKLEVVSWSQEIQAHLNRQIIVILESLGISNSTFIDLHEECIFHHIFTTPHSLEFLEKHTQFFKPTIENIHHTFFQKLLIASYNKQLLDLHRKEKIYIKNGRVLMGVIDETNILKPNEIFIMTKINDEYKPIKGKVLIAKNPCLHPGDIRIAIAVDKKELYHMKNVLVFSRKGDRPIFNMCSGSDLDGDLYFCSWEPRLLPKSVYEADKYLSITHLHKNLVSMTDIVNFYVKFMKDNELGSIANAHLSFSDQKPKGVIEPEALKLATLFNMGVDFPKTGFVARLPIDLIPSSYPDFMNIKNRPQYKSQKILGILNRRSKMLKFNISSLCDCRNCISRFFINELKVLVNGIIPLDPSTFDRIESEKNYTFINYDARFYNSIKNTNSYKNINLYLKDAREIYEEYHAELNGLLKRYGYQNEEEFFLGYLQENEEFTFEENKGTQKTINERVKVFLRKYREKFLKGCSHENFLTKIIAWYEVSKYQCGNGGSFPWLLDIFQRYKIEDVGFTYQQNDDWTAFLIENDIKFKKFIFNSHIILIEDTQKSRTLFKSDKSYVIHKIITPDKKQYSRIFIFGYLDINERLSKIKDQKVYVELFHLLFSIQFFILDEIEDAFEFIFRLVDEINDSPREMIRTFVSQRLFSLSKPNVGQCYTEDERNKLITIAALLFIDLPLVSKMKIVRQQLISTDSNLIYKEKSIIKPSLYNGISIIGMFDDNDEIYFSLLPEKDETNKNRYELQLLNEGIADKNFYKDDFRKFLLGHLWYNKEPKMLINVRIIPGKLIFYSLIPKFAHNNMKIKHLNKMLYGSRSKNEYKLENRDYLNCYFKNQSEFKAQIEMKYGEMSYEEMRIKNFEILKKASFELSLQKKNNRYGIYMEYESKKLKIKKITRKRFVCGRYEIINPKENKDYMYEVIAEELLFSEDRNIDKLESNEKILKCKLEVKMKENKFIYNIDGGYTFLRFEVNIPIKERIPFNAYKQFVFKYENGELIVDKDYIRVYKNISFLIEDVQNHCEFEKNFEKIWACYE